MAVKPGQVHRNEHGTVSGGYLSLIMDDTMGALLCALVPSGVAVTSTITFQFLEAVKPETMLLVTASVTKSGSRLGFVDCEIRSGGRVMARGSGVWLQKKAHT